jgi:pullulanase
MAHLFELKKSAFVLWSPHGTNPAPTLVIGQFQAGNPPRLANRQEFPLTQQAAHPDLWSIDAIKCRLTDGQVYHYWLKYLTAARRVTGAGFPAPIPRRSPWIGGCSRRHCPRRTSSMIRIRRRW